LSRAAEILGVACCCVLARCTGQSTSCSSAPSAAQLRDSSGCSARDLYPLRAQDMISILLGKAHSKLSHTSGLLLPLVPRASLCTSLVNPCEDVFLVGVAHGASGVPSCAAFGWASGRFREMKNC